MVYEDYSEREHQLLNTLIGLMTSAEYVAEFLERNSPSIFKNAEFLIGNMRVDLFFAAVKLARELKDKLEKKEIIREREEKLRIKEAKKNE